MKMTQENPFISLPVIKQMMKQSFKKVVIDGELEEVPYNKLVKETRYNEQFLFFEIAKVEHHIDYRKLKSSKTRCSILYKPDNQRYCIAKPKKEIEKLLDECYSRSNGKKSKQIGFVYKGKIGQHG